MCIQYDCLHVAHCIHAYTGFTHCEKKFFLNSKKDFLVCKLLFSWKVAPPARGAGGIPTSPLCPPGPPIPPSNGRGFPPDPPCAAAGTSPFPWAAGAVTGSTSGFGLGPPPIGSRNGYALFTATAPRHPPPQNSPMTATPCHHFKDKPEPTRRGRDQLRQAGRHFVTPAAATVALPGTQ